MELTSSYLYFIYTPRKYKLQINNFSVFMFISYGPPFLFRPVAPTVKTARILSSAEFLEILKDKI